jgi:signal transduction histidine kinase
MITELEGEVELERRPIAVGDLVRESVDEAQALHGRKAITVSVETGARLTVNVDPRWLSAVIMEIVSNAIRHAKKEVRVTCRADAELSIFVDDDGPGFPPGTRVQDFKRINGIGRAQGGSGLRASLAMARDVLALHGGQLCIATRREGGGARVAIILPLA